MFEISLKRKERIAWAVSLTYILYLFAGQIPNLRSNPIFNTMFVSLFLIIVFILSSYMLLGWKKTLELVVLGWLVGYSMEFLSINTGIPFGTYYYTSALGPQLGPVPIFIPFLWSSLFFYAMEASSLFLAPFLMVSIDLSFDPRYSKYLWHWTVPTQYFGDPISNFTGWFIVSIIISFLLYLLNFKPNQSKWGIIPSILFYLLFIADNTVSDFRANLGEPGIIALIVALFISLILLLYRYGRINIPLNGNKFLKKGSDH